MPEQLWPCGCREVDGVRILCPRHAAELERIEEENEREDSQ